MATEDTTKGNAKMDNAQRRMAGNLEARIYEIKGALATIEGMQAALKGEFGEALQAKAEALYRAEPETFTVAREQLLRRALRSAELDLAWLEGRDGRKWSEFKAEWQETGVRFAWGHRAETFAGEPIDLGC